MCRVTALWTSEEIVAATGGTLHGAPFDVSGVTFDSREVEQGWLFVAMPGTDVRWGTSASSCASRDSPEDA